MTEKFRWFNGASKEGYSEAEIGDGLKIYPNPARYNSGGTVKKGISGALNTYRGCGGGTFMKNGKVRYFTPRECFRLMGFDEDGIDRLIKAVPSKTNLYKLAGNSIVVDVLEAIFRGIYLENTFKQSRQEVLI